MNLVKIVIGSNPSVVNLYLIYFESKTNNIKIIQNLHIRSAGVKTKHFDKLFTEQNFEQFFVFAILIFLGGAIENGVYAFGRLLRKQPEKAMQLSKIDDVGQ
jgi:uncharacterized membrane protein